VPALTHRTILDALVELNRLISYRLKVKEIIPTKMREYYIGERFLLLSFRWLGRRRVGADPCPLGMNRLYWGSVLAPS
jgi:hypothetical protein